MAKFASAEAKEAICFLMVCMELPPVAAAGYSGVAVETEPSLRLVMTLPCVKTRRMICTRGGGRGRDVFVNTQIFYIISLAVDIYGN